MTLQMRDEENRERGREEGREEGRKEGIKLAKQVWKLVSQGYTEESIAEQLNLSKEQVRKIME